MQANLDSKLHPHEQTRKIRRFPEIEAGKGFWRDVSELMRKMVDRGSASADDLNLRHFTDSVDEVVTLLRATSIDRLGLKPTRRKAWRILLETPQILLGRAVS